MCCFILHNIAMQQNLPYDMEEMDEEEENLGAENIVPDESRRGINARNAMLNYNFH